jgi:hypothetical protein
MGGRHARRRAHAAREVGLGERRPRLGRGEANRLKDVIRMSIAGLPTARRSQSRRSPRRAARGRARRARRWPSTTAARSWAWCRGAASRARSSRSPTRSSRRRAAAADVRHRRRGGLDVGLPCGGEIDVCVEKFQPRASTRTSHGRLFSHPRDFTPICTIELGYMTSIRGDFDKRSTKIIGLSVDPSTTTSRGYRTSPPRTGPRPTTR